MPLDLSAFKTWLRQKNYSDSTVRNYLVDVNRYLNWLSNPSPPLPCLPAGTALTGQGVTRVVDLSSPLSRGDKRGVSPFDPTILSVYLKSISTTPNFKRDLSSLSQFFQYALDQNLITQNPLKTAIKSLSPQPRNTLDSLIVDFTAHLSKHHKSPSTIKNYINDIHQFIDFCQSNSET